MQTSSGYLLICPLEPYFAGLNFGVSYTVLACILWIKADTTTDYESKKLWLRLLLCSFQNRLNQISPFPPLPSQGTAPLLVSLQMLPPVRNPLWPQILLVKAHHLEIPLQMLALPQRIFWFTSCPSFLSQPGKFYLFQTFIMSYL